MNRPAMNSISLTVDTSNLTAIGNDYGYDVVFPASWKVSAKAAIFL